MVFLLVADGGVRSEARGRACGVKPVDGIEIPDDCGGESICVVRIHRLEVAAGYRIDCVASNAVFLGSLILLV